MNSCACCEFMGSDQWGEPECHYTDGCVLEGREVRA